MLEHNCSSKEIDSFAQLLAAQYNYRTALIQIEQSKFFFIQKKCLNKYYLKFYNGNNFKYEIKIL